MSSAHTLQRGGQPGPLGCMLSTVWHEAVTLSTHPISVHASGCNIQVTDLQVSSLINVHVNTRGHLTSGHADCAAAKCAWSILGHCKELGISSSVLLFMATHVFDKSLTLEEVSICNWYECTAQRLAISVWMQLCCERLNANLYYQFQTTLTGWSPSHSKPHLKSKLYPLVGSLFSKCLCIPP